MRIQTMRIVAIAALVLMTTGTASAEEKAVTLKPGPGVDKVEANCGTCHSLDYIQMNSPFQSAASWDAEVGKMIKAFGAPIGDADAKAISEYLKKNYGS